MYIFQVLCVYVCIFNFLLAFVHQSKISKKNFLFVQSDSYFCEFERNLLE